MTEIKKNIIKVRQVDYDDSSSNVITADVIKVKYDDKITPKSFRQSVDNEQKLQIPRKEARKNPSFEEILTEFKKYKDKKSNENTITLKDDIDEKLLKHQIQDKTEGQNSFQSDSGILGKNSSSIENIKSEFVTNKLKEKQLSISNSDLKTISDFTNSQTGLTSENIKPNKVNKSISKKNKAIIDTKVDSLSNDKPAKIVENILNIDNSQNQLATNEEKTKSSATKKTKIQTKAVIKTQDDETKIHIHHRQRLKNQFLNNGISYLTDIQKLELLLFFAIPQKDTNPIAHRLINEFGSLKEVFSAEFNKLITVKGIKENSALLIKLISSLNPSIDTPDMDSINTAFEAKTFCSKLFRGIDVEQFYVICLTKSNQVKKYKLLRSGSSDEVSVQIRSITELALDSKCNRIIISHNHPNGEAIMSDEDCSFTYTLICSCLLNSIELVDHIIVGRDKAISLASQNILQKLKEIAFKSLNFSRERKIYLSNNSNEYLLDKSEAKYNKFKFQ